MPSFQHFPYRPMTEVHMHTWGKMMPRRGKPDFPYRIMLDVVEMLESEEGHPLYIGAYPYVGLD